MRQCEADPGHFQHTFKVAGAVPVGSGFAALPQDPGVEQQGHIQLRHLPVCGQTFHRHIPVADDLETFDPGVFGIFHLFHGVRQGGVDPEERVKILQLGAEIQHMRDPVLPLHRFYAPPLDCGFRRHTENDPAADAGFFCL